jgi:hypothetical protein
MNEIYKPINPIERSGSDTLNELRISVRYDKGSMNYFHGQENKRGLYVHVTPVHRGNGFVSGTLLGSRKESGFKMFVRELGRASQKQADDVFSRVEPLADEIAKKWNTEDWEGIFQMVKQAM